MPIYKMDGSKDGKQKYRVRVNITDNMGNHRQIDRVAYGKSEAKELERKLTLETKEQSPTVRMTVNDLCKEYLNNSKNELRESTVDKARTNIKIYVQDICGNKSLSNLTIPFFQDWKNKIEEYQSPKTGKSLSLTTKQKIYSCFRAVINYGVKMCYIPVNNLIKLGNFKDSNSVITKKEMDFYTPEEYKKFSKAAYDIAKSSGKIVDWDYYVFFSIAFYTGLRKGEIFALKWSDIDGEYLSVTRSITQKLKGEDRETPPKNKSSIRELHMPKPLIDILNEHKKRYKLNNGFSKEYRICGGAKPIRDSSVAKANEKFAEAAVVKKIRIHDFRHSHASLLANEGINIQEIARRLGHSDTSMTWNTYSHLYPREEERAVEILNKIK